MKADVPDFATGAATVHSAALRPTFPRRKQSPEATEGRLEPEEGAGVDARGGGLRWLVRRRM